MVDGSILLLPNKLLNNLPLAWTTILLVSRFTAFMLIIPGLGQSARGLPIRMAGIIILSVSSLSSSGISPLPDDIAVMIWQITSEFLLGLVIGIIPFLIVVGAQLAGQLSSMTMGLNASGLIDPSLGVPLSDLGRLYGDLVTITFLLLGGHRTVIYALSGINSSTVPGQFIPNDASVLFLIERTGDLFRIGMMLSAPVIVALLLTQFVMGLISKAVPAVNIFIISFPLTIGIGLILTAYGLQDASHFFAKELSSIENSLGVFLPVK